MRNDIAEMKVNNLVDEAGFWKVLDLLRVVAEQRANDYWPTGDQMVSVVQRSWLAAYDNAAKSLKEIIDVATVESNRVD